MRWQLHGHTNMQPAGGLQEAKCMLRPLLLSSPGLPDVSVAPSFLRRPVPAWPCSDVSAVLWALMDAAASLARLQLPRSHAGEDFLVVARLFINTFLPWGYELPLELSPRAYDLAARLALVSSAVRGGMLGSDSAWLVPNPAAWQELAGRKHCTPLWPTCRS